jgi:hypothetical protein
MRFFLCLCLFFSAVFIFCSCKTSRINKVPGPNDNFVETNKNDHRVKIWITKGDVTTQKLSMAYKGYNADHVRAWSNQTIIWKVADTANVNALDNFMKKSGDDVFAKNPYKKSGKKWKAKLKTKHKDDPYEEQEYIIYWKDENNNNHIYDPYMRVNPR